MIAPLADEGAAAVASGDGFRIRHKVSSDLAQDWAWRRDPDLARFDGRPITSSAREDFLQQGAFDLRYESPWSGSYSIDDEAGRHIGNAMFYNVSLDRDRAEIGLMIGYPELWGGGLGTRLTVAFVRHLWESQPFRQITLHTLEWNERAVRCFRSAGFDTVARVLRDDTWFTRMEARREWWLLWDGEGRFEQAGRRRESSTRD